MNAWQQLEGVRMNMLILRIDKNGRQKYIRSATIPTNPDNIYRTMKQHSTARQMKRIFNALTCRLNGRERKILTKLKEYKEIL